MKSFDTFSLDLDEQPSELDQVNNSIRSHNNVKHYKQSFPIQLIDVFN